MRKHIAQGTLKVDEDGKLDPDQPWPVGDDNEVRTAEAVVRTESDAKAAVNLIYRILQEHGGAPPGGPTLSDTRKVESILRSYLKDLELKRERRELVPAKQAQEHANRAFVGYRRAMQNIPARHASQIAAELGCDPAKLEALMVKAIVAELNDLSGPVVGA